MKKLKKLCMAAISAVLVVTLILSTGISAYAESVNGIWYIGQVNDDAHPRFFGWKGSGNISVDDKVYSNGSRCSLKLSNQDEYGDILVEKEVTLEPYTTYKFSAKVKYSGFKLAPNSSGKYSGAFLSVYSYIDGDFNLIVNSQTSQNKQWTEISCIFTTGAEKKDYYIRLLNGSQAAKCKGTAWFSDVKLEKAELTNDWNVLVVFFKNIDVNVDLHNKKTTLQPKGKGKTHYKASISDKDLKHIKSDVNNLKKSVKTISNGLVNVKDIDTVTILTPITDVVDTNDKKAYKLNMESELISQVLDKRLKEKQYNQIVIFAPMMKIAGSSGLGGEAYNGVNFSVSYYDETYYETVVVNKDFPEGTMVHEMLHGVDVASKIYDPDTPDLHDYLDVYSEYYDGKDDWYKFYSDYMTHNLPDGKGIDPRAYYRPSGKYTLVDGSMTVGGLIEPSKTFPIDISKVKAAKVADCSYTGKKIFPSVTLTDGDYTLKKGVDYTISCKNNVNVGTATVIIKGMGLYTGTVTKKFNIVKSKVTNKPPTVTASRKDNVIKISWSEVAGAEKYIIWVSKGGGEYKLLKELDSSKTSYSIKVNGKKGEYQYALSVYVPELKEQYTKYVYTEKV